MVVWLCMMKTWRNDLSLTKNNYNLIIILDGLYLEFAINLMELCVIMRRFAFMMIYFIELNELIRIKISLGSLYQMNQMKLNFQVKQQKNMMTRSKRKRILLAKNYPSIPFKERGRNFQLTMGTTNLMTSY